ncbi:MAG TPA: X2-like carbohydrate binding domain-containing protein, partial [Clostridia bacterium]
NDANLNIAKNIIAPDDNVNNGWVHYTYYYKIIRAGKKVTMFYSYDGKNYSFAQEGLLPDTTGDSQKISVDVQNWADSGSYFDCDYIYVKDLTPPTPTPTPSPTPTPTPTPTPFNGTYIIHEDFNSIQLDSSWVLNTHTGHGTISLTDNPGSLRYKITGSLGNTVLEPTKWSPSTCLSKEFKGENWEFDCKASYNLSYPGSGAQCPNINILFGSGIRNYLHISRGVDQGYDINAHDYSIVFNDANLNTAKNIIAPDDTVNNGWVHYTYYYKIIRTGKKVTMYYSYDGKNYSFAQEGLLPDTTGDSQKISVDTQNWADSGSYFDCDYIYVKDLTLPTPSLSPSEIHANTGTDISLSIGGNTLASIMNGEGTLVPDVDYKVSGSIVTISKWYLNYYFTKFPNQNLYLNFKFASGLSSILTVYIGDSPHVILTDALLYDPSSGDAKLNLILNGNFITGIKNGEYSLVQKIDYTNSPSTHTLEIRKSYLDSYFSKTSEPLKLTVYFTGDAPKTVVISLSRV